MRRSSGRPWNRIALYPPATAVVLLAVIATAFAPLAAAGEPEWIVGGGDDPTITMPQSPADLAVNRWKAREALRLRSAVEHPRRGGSAQPEPAFLAPPCDDCPPVTYILDSHARQQITSYYCGPASTQVIINQTRGIVSTSTSGESTTTNYRAQSVIADYMGTDTSGSSAWMVKSGLNHFAALATSGSSVSFTVADMSSGSDFHWAMVTATWILRRGAAVPVQMTYSSQHLASWTSSTWWNSNKSTTVRHWISIYGYSGLWDGTYGPTLYLTDSSGRYGGSTGNFTNASRLVYNLSQANSGRIVY